MRVINIGLYDALSFAHVHAHIKALRRALTLHPAYELRRELAELGPLQPVSPPTRREVGGKRCRPSQTVALHGQEGIDLGGDEQHFGGGLAIGHYIAIQIRRLRHVQPT